MTGHVVRKVDNDNDNDTLIEVPHWSDEGVRKVGEPEWSSEFSSTRLASFDEASMFVPFAPSQILG